MFGFIIILMLLIYLGFDTVVTEIAKLVKFVIELFSKKRE